ncbi:MAG: NAD(P)/FAD-dependent oxidoreductase [Flavobacteriales bacterium]
MVDVHIIGQGLAGSVAALELLRNGQTIHVSNDPSLSHCSRTAAGLFNPLNFKTLSRTWNADVVFPVATKFYKDCEHQLKTSFWHPLPMLRIIGSEGEQKEWKMSLSGNEFAPFLNHDPVPEEMHTYNRGFGLGLVDHCGYLDTNTFLEAVTAMLIDKNIYSEYNCKQEPEKTNQGWNINGIESRHILYCEGWKAMENPLFNWLPFFPVKGDVILIEDDHLKLGHLINAGCFILPIGSNSYRIGSTYYRGEKDDVPTQKGRKELQQKAEKVLNRPINISKQWAGVRPSTGDRRPFIGEHPSKKGIWIFNGLGSRGVILSPWVARQLSSSIIFGTPIPQETDIVRHLKRFRKV